MNRKKRISAVARALDEASYDGNLGAMEVFQFYKQASEQEIAEFEAVMSSGDEEAGWDIVQNYTGVNLVGLGSAAPTSAELHEIIREELGATRKNKNIKSYVSEHYDKKKLKFCDLVHLVEQEMDEAPKGRITSPCAKQKPAADAMRFEYVVIEAARKAAGAAVGTGDPAYACARADWHTNPTTGELTKIGKQADLAIEQARKYLEKDFGGASMGGVTKSKPAWGGGKIEPKTDVMFGKRRISLKMSGAVQAASSEAAGTAQVLGFIVSSWLEENKGNTIMNGTKKAAAEEVEKLFAAIQEDMIEQGKAKLFASSRPKQIINKIEELEAMEQRSDKEQEKLDKYKNYLHIMVTKGFVSAAGDLLKSSFDYDNWQETFGQTLNNKIDEIFNSVSAVTSGGESALSLRDVLVDELLSGRRAFANNPAASAEYLLSPEHCFTLVPEDPGYEQTLATFRNVVKLRVAPKGGRPLGPASEGLNIDVASKPSFRYDIKPDDLEEAMQRVAALVAKAEEDGDVPDFSSLEALVEDTIKKTIEPMKQSMVKTMEGALDQETMASEMELNEEAQGFSE